MRKNLFKHLSNKDLRACYYSCLRVQINREKSKEDEIFSKYIDEYILMLNWKYDDDDDKKYNIGFSIAERDMLYVMAKRYLKLCDIINRFKPFFSEDA